MYLVSIYFDEKTNQIIQNYTNQVAKITGNTFMTEGNVPPHITVSAFETKQEEQIIKQLEEITENMEEGEIQWVSVGQFFPYVIHMTPVVNEYLHDLSRNIYDRIRNIPETEFSPYYKPYQWFPHTTVGKKLSSEEMQKAFEVLQRTFIPFSGKVVKIGLAKTNPYRDVFVKSF